jgi:hypothetical protein
MIQFDVSGFNAVFEDLEHDMRLLINLLDDPTFLDLLRGLLANNFERVWGSEGANIGSDWNGRTLVKTGRLRASLTRPGQIQFTISNDKVTFTSSVGYDKYVNDMYRFYGVDSTFDSALGDLVNGYLQQYGKLSWS